MSHLKLTGCHKRHVTRRQIWKLENTNSGTMTSVIGLRRLRRVVRGTIKNEKNHHLVILGILEIQFVRSFWASMMMQGTRTVTRCALYRPTFNCACVQIRPRRVAGRTQDARSHTLQEWLWSYRPYPN